MNKLKSLKFTNTSKHFDVGLKISLAFAIVEKLVAMLPNTIFRIWWMGLILLSLYAIKLELIQCTTILCRQEKLITMESTGYWCMCLPGGMAVADIIAGVAGYAVIGWLSGLI